MAKNLRQEILGSKFHQCGLNKQNYFQIPSFSIETKQQTPPQWKNKVTDFYNNVRKVHL